MERVEQDAVATHKGGDAKGVVYHHPAQQSALFCHTHEFETARHIDWTKLLTSFSGMSLAMYEQSPPWLDVLALPSEGEPGIKNVRCTRPVCRGDVLGFLFGELMPTTKAESRLLACNTPQEALEIAGRMHTFTTAPGDHSSCTQSRDQLAQQQPGMLTLMVDSDVAANPLAQMLETTDSPNAAIMMVSNFPAGPIYFPVMAMRDIAAGEVITYKKLEPSHTAVIRAFMHANMSAPGPPVAVPGLSAAEVPTVYRAPTPNAAETAPAGPKGHAASSELLAEVASAACSSVLEIQGMLEAALAACELQPLQQQQDAGELAPDSRQPLKWRLFHVNKLMQQAVLLLTAANPPAQAATAAASDLHPDTLNTEAALQNSADGDLTAPDCGAVAAAADKDAAVATAGEFGPGVSRLPQAPSKGAAAAQESAGLTTAEVADVAGEGVPETAPAAVPAGSAAVSEPVGPAGHAAKGGDEPTTCPQPPSPRALNIPVASQSDSVPSAQQQQQPSCTDAAKVKAPGTATTAAAASPQPAARALSKQPDTTAVVQQHEQELGSSAAAAKAPSAIAAAAAGLPPAGKSRKRPGTMALTHKQQQKICSTHADAGAPDTLAAALPAATTWPDTAVSHPQHQQQPSTAAEVALHMEATANSLAAGAAPQTVPAARATRRRPGVSAVPQQQQPVGTDAEALGTVAAAAAAPSAQTATRAPKARMPRHLAQQQQQQQQPSGTDIAPDAQGAAAVAALPAAGAKRKRPDTTVLPPQQQQLQLSSTDAEGKAPGIAAEAAAAALHMAEAQQQPTDTGAEALAPVTAAEPPATAAQQAAQSTNKQWVDINAAALASGAAAAALVTGGADDNTCCTAAAGESPVHQLKRPRALAEQAEQPMPELRRVSARQQQQQRRSSVEPASPTAHKAAGAAAAGITDPAAAAAAAAAAVLAASKPAGPVSQLPAQVSAEINEHLNQLRVCTVCSSSRNRHQQEKALLQRTAAAAAAAAQQLRLLAQEGQQHRKAIGPKGIPLLVKLLHSTTAAAQQQAAAALEVLSQEERYAGSVCKALPRLVELLVAGEAPQATDTQGQVLPEADHTTQHVAAVLFNLLDAAAVAPAIVDAGGATKLLQLLDRALTDLESSGGTGGRGSRSSTWDITNSSSRLDLLDPVLGCLRHMAYPAPDDITRAICAAGGTGLFMRAVTGSTAAAIQLAGQQQHEQQQHGGGNVSGGAAAAGTGSKTLQKLQRVQEHALGALWNIARVPDLQPGIHIAAAAATSTGAAASNKAQGYKMIVLCLSSESCRVQYEACGLLQWLAVATPVCKTAIIAAGAIQPLVAILGVAAATIDYSSSGGDSSSSDGKDEQMELKGNAAGVLWHLADGSRPNQSAIAAAGAIPRLVELLNHDKGVYTGGNAVASSSSLETMQREAAGALRALAFGNPAIKDSIAKTGGVQQLVQLLSMSRSSDVQSIAVAALAEVVKGKPVHKNAAVEAGARQVLKGLAGSAEENVASTAKSVLLAFE